MDASVTNVSKHKGCMDKPSFIMKVRIELAYFKAVFIHPDNNTYPIFSIEVQKTGVDYWKKCDHDQINLNVKNLQVFDNTHYPETLNPRDEYTSESELHSHEIMGVNTNRELSDQNMLSFTCYLFAYPNEVQCEAQKLCGANGNEVSTEHNILVKMELQ